MPYSMLVAVAALVLAGLPGSALADGDPGAAELGLNRSDLRGRVAPRPRRCAPSVERDHAADPVLGLHQLEAAVDLVEREPVVDQRVDVDLAR